MRAPGIGGVARPPGSVGGEDVRRLHGLAGRGGGAGQSGVFQPRRHGVPRRRNRVGAVSVRPGRNLLRSARGAVGRRRCVRRGRARRIAAVSRQPGAGGRTGLRRVHGFAVGGGGGGQSGVFRARRGAVPGRRAGTGAVPGRAGRGVCRAGRSGTDRTRCVPRVEGGNGGGAGQRRDGWGGRVPRLPGVAAGDARRRRAGAGRRRVRGLPFAVGVQDARQRRDGRKRPLRRLRRVAVAGPSGCARAGPSAPIRLASAGCVLHLLPLRLGRGTEGQVPGSCGCAVLRTVRGRRTGHRGFRRHRPGHVGLAGPRQERVRRLPLCHPGRTGRRLVRDPGEHERRAGGARERSRHGGPDARPGKRVRAGRPGFLHVCRVRCHAAGHPGNPAVGRHPVLRIPTVLPLADRTDSGLPENGNPGFREAGDHDSPGPDPPPGSRRGRGAPGAHPERNRPDRERGGPARRLVRGLEGRIPARCRKIRAIAQGRPRWLDRRFVFRRGRPRNRLPHAGVHRRTAALQEIPGGKQHRPDRGPCSLQGGFRRPRAGRRRFPGEPGVGGTLLRVPEERHRNHRSDARHVEGPFRFPVVLFLPGAEGGPSLGGRVLHHGERNRPRPGTVSLPEDRAGNHVRGCPVRSRRTPVLLARREREIRSVGKPGFQAGAPGRPARQPVRHLVGNAHPVPEQFVLRVSPAPDRGLRPGIRGGVPPDHPGLALPWGYQQHDGHVPAGTASPRFPAGRRHVRGLRWVEGLSGHPEIHSGRGPTDHA